MLIENLIILRSLEYEDHLYRIISVLKMRFSDFDASLREFQIADGGMRVLPIIESGQGVITGITQQERRKAPDGGAA